MIKPPMSQVELVTRPMEAEAFAPRVPTMEASMYCMVISEMFARMAGKDSFATIMNSSFLVSGLFSRINAATFKFFVIAIFKHK